MKDINNIERINPFVIQKGEEDIMLKSIENGDESHYEIHRKSSDGICNPFVEVYDSLDDALAVLNPPSKYSLTNTPITKTPVLLQLIQQPAQQPHLTHEQSTHYSVEQIKQATTNDFEKAAISPTVGRQIDVPIPKIPVEKALCQNNNTQPNKNQTTVIIENKKENITSFDVSVELIQKLPFAIIDKELYCFNGNYYSIVDSDDVNSLIMTLCPDEVRAKGYPRFVKDIQEFIRMWPELKLTTSVQNSFPHCLAFNNGVLNLQNWSFVPHSPAIFLTYKVCTDFSPTANLDTPSFDRYLLQTFNGEPQLIERMWESLGYLITNDHNGKAFFVLQGVGDSGKSMLIHFIESLFPESLICPAQLSDFGERFGMSIMNGKKLCICADLPKKPINEQAAGMIKAMTGGDVIACEGKYEAKKTFKNTAKLICATNHPVTLASEDEAFMRRMIIIPFIYSIPKEQQDHMLIEKLKDEKQAIVIKALQAYCRLRDRNYVFSGSDLVNSLRLNAAPVVVSTESLIEEFVNLHCKFVSEEQFTSTDDLCTAYNQFTSQRGLPLMDKTDFSKRLKEKYSPRITDYRVTVSGKKTRGYRGIILVGAQTETTGQ